MAVRGEFVLGGKNHPRPRGSLEISEARELLVKRSIPAAFELDGTVVKDTLRLIQEDWWGVTPELDASDMEIAELNEEAVLWGGFMAPQYGHFLVESAARLWPLLPGAPLEGARAVFPGRIPAFAKEWFEVFGADLIDLPKDGVVKFTRMFVAEPAWRLGAWIAPEIRDIHLHARGGFDVPDLPRRDVGWISRAGLGPHRVPYDEGLLELLLRDHLWVVQPERHPLATQIGMLESCRTLAGIPGSAFHTLLMTRKTPDCVYMCPSWDKPTYPAQHRLLSSDATFVPVLEPSGWKRRIREGVAFPGGYRISIPRALKVLRDTVLPDLFEDPRIARIGGVKKVTGSELGVCDAAITRVVEDPGSVTARMELGAIFEAEGNDRCALEQFMAVADLADHDEAAMATSRLLENRGHSRGAALYAAQARRITA